MEGNVCQGRVEGLSTGVRQDLDTCPPTHMAVAVYQGFLSGAFVSVDVGGPVREVLLLGSPVNDIGHILLA